MTKQTEPPDAGLNRIERRIVGRRMAAEVAEYLSGHMQDRYFMDSLVHHLSIAAGLKPAEPVVEKLEPIARLGATRMEFGQHVGKTLDDVPRDYLDWLCATQEDFYGKLRAYLKHPELESRRRGLER